MASFFLWSDWGDLHFLARLLQNEGHDAVLYTEHPTAGDVGRGLIERTRSKVVPPKAIVLFDGPGHGRWGDLFRQRGHKVIGGNPLDTDLELKRGKAMQLLEAADIAIPETYQFKSYADAIRFLQRQEGKWFFKAEGNKACALSLGGKVETLVRELEWERRMPPGKDVDRFILQKHVHGVEVSTEGWYDGKKWVLPFNGTFEEKHLMPGNLGPRTGCQQNVVWTYNEEAPALPAATVMALEEQLREAKYCGPIDINAIVDDDGCPYALEVSARFGFDALQALTALFPIGTVGEQLASFAAGELDTFTLRTDALACTLRVSIPPYPIEDPPTKRRLGESRLGAQVRGRPLDHRLLDRPRRILVDDVMVAGDRPVCAGRDGAVCVLVAVADTIEDCRTELLEVAESLDIRDKQYRNDPPVKRAERDWARLRAAGLLRSGPPDIEALPELPYEDEEDEHPENPVVDDDQHDTPSVDETR